MSSQKNRQRAVQRARAERIRAAELKAAQRRKRIIQAAAVAVCLALIALLVLTIGGGDKKKTNVATATSTSTSTAPGATKASASAAGKPCVPVNGPLPAGAPAVPVKVGPPPQKLLMEDLKPGSGAVVRPESTVTVNYIGVACSTGKIFDNSYSRGQPASFALSGVIPGWTQGIPGMKVGGTRLLGIPSALAYGPQGQGADIAPDEPLWFVVEVLDAKPPASG